MLLLPRVGWKIYNSLQFHSLVSASRPAVGLRTAWVSLWTSSVPEGEFSHIRCQSDFTGLERRQRGDGFFSRKIKVSELVWVTHVIQKKRKSGNIWCWWKSWYWVEDFFKHSWFAPKTESETSSLWEISFCGLFQHLWVKQTASSNIFLSGSCWKELHHELLWFPYGRRCHGTKT